MCHVSVKCSSNKALEWTYLVIFQRHKVEVLLRLYTAVMSAFVIVLSVMTSVCVHAGPVGSRRGGCEDPSGHKGFERSHIAQSKQRDLGRRFTDLRGAFLDSKLTATLSQSQKKGHS